MRIDAKRLISATDARTTLPALLDAARDRRITHILRDRTVVAHLVPGDARVVTRNIEKTLRLLVARAAVEDFIDAIERQGYSDPGDDIGRVLAWVWDCQEDAAIAWFGVYADVLTEQLHERGIARPAFDQLWWAMSVTLGGSMLEGSVCDFEIAVRQRLHDLGYGQMFTAAELAGHGRQRSADDPWPDADSAGRGWAKRRWQDIKAFEFVPDPAMNHTLAAEDDWCRVETITGNEAILRRADGTSVTASVNANHWVPFRTEEPWRWGR